MFEIYESLFGVVDFTRSDERERFMSFVKSRSGGNYRFDIGEEDTNIDELVAKLEKLDIKF